MDSFIATAAKLFDDKVDRQRQHSKHAHAHPDRIHPRVALVEDDREGVQHPEYDRVLPSAGNHHLNWIIPPLFLQFTGHLPCQHYQTSPRRCRSWLTLWHQTYPTISRSPVE